MTKPSLAPLETRIGEFKYWVQRVMPMVYDDSLSFIELLHKVYEHLNTIGNLTNEVVVLWNEINEWVLNDGLTENVVDKINALVSDGTMDTIINDNVLSKKIDKGQVTVNDINKNEGLFDETYFTETVKQQWTGNTPLGTVPPDRSITSIKLAFDSVTPELTSFYTEHESLNKLDHNKTSVGIIGVGGAVDSTQTGFFTTDFIPVETNDIVRFAFSTAMGSNNRLYLYDTNKVFIAQLDGTEESVGVSRVATVTNASAKYIRTSYPTALKNAGAMVIKNAPYLSYFQSYYHYFKPTTEIQLSDEQKQNAKDYISGEVGIVKPTSTSFITETKSNNLLDPSKITEGGIPSPTGIDTLNGFFTTDYIPVMVNDVIRYSYSSEMGNNNAIYLYDGSKNFIEKLALGTLDVSNAFRISTIKNGYAKFFRLGYPNTALNTSAMIVKNVSFPSPYEPFVLRHTLDSTFDFGSVTNPLYGKTVAWNGDSIMQGLNANGGFAKVISERNSMVYENRGIGGGTIATGTYYNGDTGNPRHWVSTDVNNMRSDADYVILEGGVNDGSLSVPLGAVSTGYTATLDTTTFCGAFETMLKNAYQRFSGKKIGFVQVHYMTSSQNTYLPYVYQILEKWGVPYIDLFKESPPLAFIDHLKTAYTLNADGWHPNSEGYAKYYTDKIEAFMKTL